MDKIKPEGWKKTELIGFCSVILFIAGHGILRHDSCSAMISALCGISYTFWAGKGYPACYLFGITGSGFYSYLAFQNALWGNLLLYSGYYIPMQILGFFQWNKNLKDGKSEIVKTKLFPKELTILVLLVVVSIVTMGFILLLFNGAHPILDSVTTVCSIAGMYLTVKRAIEQWIFWMIVNALSLIMWTCVLFSGARVYSTVLMWAVYLFLALYFYRQWKREI